MNRHAVGKGPAQSHAGAIPPPFARRQTSAGQVPPAPGRVPTQSATNLRARTAAWPRGVTSLRQPSSQRC